MKTRYDFSRAKRGPIARPARGKTRITVERYSAKRILEFDKAELQLDKVLRGRKRARAEPL